MTFFNSIAAAAVLRTACDTGHKRRGRGLKEVSTLSQAGTAAAQASAVLRWSDPEQ